MVSTMTDYITSNNHVATNTSFTAHATYYAQLTLQPRRFQYTNMELRDATRKLTLPNLIEYSKDIWEKGRGEALVQGNIDKDEALAMVDVIGDALPFKSISSANYPPRLKALPLPVCRAKMLPPRLLIAEPNLSNQNSASYITLQSLGQADLDHVLIELIGAIVQEPFYNELRTKQQLGYIVSSGVRAVGESRTLSFIVQSSVAPPSMLTVEMLAFLDSIDDRLFKDLPVADLDVYIKSLIDRKTEPDKDLSIEVTRNWSEIASGRLRFDRLQNEAAALLSVTKDALREFWEQLYAGDGRRLLVTEVVPIDGPASSTLPPTSTRYTFSDLYKEELTLGIDDIQQFRMDREKWNELQI
jgi:insulysin